MTNIIHSWDHKVKFIYLFFKIFHLVNFKGPGRFRQIYLAFLEYMNFTRIELRIRIGFGFTVQCSVALHALQDSLTLQRKISIKLTHLILEDHWDNKKRIFRSWKTRIQLLIQIGFGLTVLALQDSLRLQRKMCRKLR